MTSQNYLAFDLGAESGRAVIGAFDGRRLQLGNIILQMLAQNVFDSVEEARGVVRESFPLKAYEPKSTSAWDAAYDRFKHLATASGEQA